MLPVSLFSWRIHVFCISFYPLPVIVKCILWLWSVAKMLENVVKTKNVRPYEVCVPFVTNFFIAERTFREKLLTDL